MVVPCCRHRTVALEVFPQLASYSVCHLAAKLSCVQCVLHCICTVVLRRTLIRDHFGRISQDEPAFRRSLGTLAWLDRGQARNVASFGRRTSVSMAFPEIGADLSLAVLTHTCAGCRSTGTHAWSCTMPVQPFEYEAGMSESLLESRAIYPGGVHHC